MKKRVVDFIKERDEEILSSYKNVIRKLKSIGVNEDNPNGILSYISMEGIRYLTVTSGASRFYVSTEEAVKVIMRAHHGFPFNFDQKEKQKMYTEIYKRYKEVILIDKRNIYSVLEDIINSPAPSFYITQRYLNLILQKHK